MNSSREVKFLIVLLIVFFLVMLFACKEPVEGCLDVDAVNYNVLADDPCEDCCTYPVLEVQFNHQYDTLLFSYDSIYNFAGSDAQFEKVVYYLSDFQLRSSTDSFEVIDTRDLDLLSGGVLSVKDDFVLLSPGRSIRYDLGETRGGAATYDVLSFNVGLTNDVAFTNAGTISDEDHPLAFGIDTLWTDPEGYIFNQITLIPDTTDQDQSRIINIRGNSALLRIELPYEQIVSPGTDITLPIRIDYQKWFSGIDFVGQSDIEIIEIIVNNTAEAFSIDD